MGKDYGYARISTKRQSIDRQIRNILAVSPDAVIFQEVFTGTKFYGRKELDKLLRVVKSGDRIIFDSVSRMSRNADEGVKLYFELYDKGISLVFLKEPHIDTEVYKEALQHQVALTGSDADILIEAINAYLCRLRAKEIELAFEQAEKEVKDLRKRTSEGILSAKLEGTKQIGGVKGKKLNVKKSVVAKSKIQELSKDFGGSLSDKDLIAITGVSRNTYYKYKREIMIERVG